MRALECAISIPEGFLEEQGEVLMFSTHYPKTRPQFQSSLSNLTPPTLPSLFPSGRAAAGPELIHAEIKVGIFV